MVVSVSGTIIQLIDETNLQAVAGGVKMESEIRARSTSSEGAGMVDGWIGGTWVSESPSDGSRLTVIGSTPNEILYF